jgi:hypothetical protein
MTTEKLTPYQLRARRLRKEALAFEVFDMPKEAKEKRKEAKLFDNLQEFHEEYLKNRKNAKI